MNLTTSYLTENRCFLAGRTIKPKGIMVHSTATPGVMAKSWVKRWNNADISVCVHAFADNTGVYQTLPWNHRGWHCGVGSNGSGNNTHISFEICEPSGFSYSEGAAMVGYDAAKQQPYFDAVWANAVELCAFLCKKYGLDEKDVICHSEGAKLGIASNHADVMHWFPKHGQSMDTFRAAVKAALADKSTVSAKTMVTAKTTAPAIMTALQKLEAAGVIESIDYWKIHAADVPYLDALIEKAAEKAAAGKNRNIGTVQDAISALVSAGVIQSQDYWLSNYGKVQYLDQLIIKLANAIG